MSAYSFSSSRAGRYRTPSRSPWAKRSRRLRARLRAMRRAALLAIGFAAVILFVLRRSHLL